MKPRTVTVREFTYQARAALDYFEGMVINKGLSFMSYEEWLEYFTRWSKLQNEVVDTLAIVRKSEI